MPPCGISLVSGLRSECSSPSIGSSGAVCRLLTAAYQQRARRPTLSQRWPVPLPGPAGIRGSGLRAGTHGLGKRRGDRASSSCFTVLSALSRHIRFRVCSRGGLEPLVFGRGLTTIELKSMRIQFHRGVHGFHGALQLWHSQCCGAGALMARPPVMVGQDMRAEIRPVSDFILLHGGWFVHTH